MSIAKSSASTSATYCSGYSEDVDRIREREYPLLKDTTYLDHAGTTLYAKSLIDSFSRDLTSSLYGNPHSMSASSQLSAQRVDDIRLRALRFFNADPDEFDLVFVANATAGIKLIADAFRDSPRGFWYGYHVDAHTSLVGVRELAAAGSRCFVRDDEVDAWAFGLESEGRESLGLFAYPAQSNMNGRRFPMRWCEQVRARCSKAENKVYTLLDAASFVSTSPLDLSNASTAPDFTVLSFYKIFGFPDLGALIVRKSAGDVFRHRKFFGGGTVNMVLTGNEPWHAKKESSIHERLEDGTLPFHSIIALESAFETHRRLYGSMENIASHTRFLAKRLHDRMVALKHYNGTRACQLYTTQNSSYDDPSTQGPILAFNLHNSRGMWIGKSEVERLASIKNIQIRSGTLCNPGGTAVSLGWSGADMLRHFSAGMRCGDEHDIMDERPTGILRVSLGAMSSQRDVDAFVAFLEEFYVDKLPEGVLVPLMRGVCLQQPSFYVESLSVYPIKSCGAFRVPDGQRWEVRREGLAWDREWCLVHQGTGVTLNQKRYPRMALIRPTLDLGRGILRIICGEAHALEGKTLEISLNRMGTNALTTSLCQNASKPSTVCGDKVVLQAYTSPAVSSFFSNFLGVPCTLARFPPQSSTRSYAPRKVARSRSHNQSPSMPGSFPQAPSSPSPSPTQTPILLSNESPLLLISRSSVNRLNESIKSTPRANPNSSLDSDNFPGSGTNSNKAVAADVFRANIVVAENIPTAERPYIEDTWASLRIGSGSGSEQLRFNVLGSCERCQMVCVDQYTGQRGDEPYATLAKTRKVERKILFGRHISPVGDARAHGEGGCLGTVMVGDVVVPSYEDDDES
ncbi:putative molybdenum cofactor sulfurase protein (HxB) [Aspergillus mulundensis]|uniref:Molybdenum cofactor sulfurase n=1 Tax=Aspergillus mulundensis TaxID=1810919 RepID=A0A3D8S4W8_9EURO|nr:Molybdenum cofactor sulfurase [Aspergillus mulundensis]RDW81296.1 Molybdenum cofactor sulfurase [Aspergillus mulundensis]